jgi:hypothetical protein
MLRYHKASHARGRRLIAAGCPLDYVGHIPGELAPDARLYAYELGGYPESRLVDFGTRTGYLVTLGVGTNLPGGNLISDWTFEMPWPELISWDYDPVDISPSQCHLYGPLINSRLSAALKGRSPLTRGYPVEGVLCGRAEQPIPESFANAAMIDAQLGLTDDTGHTATLRVPLRVHRAGTPKGTSFAYSPPPKRKGGLLDKRDLIPKGRREKPS